MCCLPELAPATGGDGVDLLPPLPGFFYKSSPVEEVENFVGGHDSGTEAEPLLDFLSEGIGVGGVFSEDFEDIDPQAVLGVQ